MENFNCLFANFTTIILELIPKVNSTVEFTLRIYVGKMFAIDLPDNFRYPYISKSMTEFWRRWHITLGSWFRDYVYIPLGGNRRGIGRTYINLFIVWILTGFWHGASWNFILWGLFLFAVIAIEKSGLLKILESNKIKGNFQLNLEMMRDFLSVICYT